MANLSKEELWVGWTRDAIGRYLMPDNIEDIDDLVDDMADAAAKYADVMLEEFEERFSGGDKRTRRRRKTEDDDDAD